MQSIQLVGTYSFASNIANVKIGDLIKLQIQYSSRTKSDAIGAFTQSNLKIGYVPYNPIQIDTTIKYRVTQIKSYQGQLSLIISSNDPQTNCNFIYSEPEIIQKIKRQRAKLIDINPELKKALFHFKTGMNKQHLITNIEVLQSDCYFIDLKIHQANAFEPLEFKTVTHKYYDENVFKYDEFYEKKLIPHNIYKQFQTHRLEVYLENNYKCIQQISKIKLNKISKLLSMTNEPIVFEPIINSTFKLVNIDSNCSIELITLIVKYSINNQSPHPNNLTQLLTDNLNLLIETQSVNPNILIQNITDLVDIFDNLKVGGYCYNSELKLYCQIDLYDGINIIDIIDCELFDLMLNSVSDTEKPLTGRSNQKAKEYLMELILKLTIGNKYIIVLYDPILGRLLRAEINENLVLEIIKILG
jgi:hypothetical protein